MKFLFSFFLILLCLPGLAQSSSAIMNKAIEYHENEEYDKAIELYNLLITKDSIFTSALHNRALSYIAKGELEQAENDLVLALKLEPNNSSSNYSLAIVYQRMRNYFLSEKYFRLAIDFSDEKKYDSYYGLGSSFYFSGELDSAKKYLHVAIEIDSLQKEAINNLAWSYLDTSPEQSCKLFRKAYELDDTDAVMINNLGYSHLLCGDFEEAYDFFQKALKIEPENSFIYRNIGLYYMQKDEKKAACKNLKKALDLKIVEDWGESYVEVLMNYCN